MKVLIVTLTGELPRYYEYYDSIDRLVTPPQTEKITVHSSSPAKNRNVAIAGALQPGRYSHLFFTDDDHVYMPNTLMRLLSHDKDIVSGMYTMKFSPFPIVALNNPNSGEMGQFINMNNHPPNKLIEVARVPAGCLLVKTSVLKGMQDDIVKYWSPKYKNKWFTLGHIQPDEWGDDLWFCDRAIDAGYIIYLDTGCPVGHITKTVLWPEWNPETKEWQVRFKINEEYSIGHSTKPDGAVAPI